MIEAAADRFGLDFSGISAISAAGPCCRLSPARETALMSPRAPIRAVAVEESFTDLKTTWRASPSADIHIGATSGGFELEAAERRRRNEAGETEVIEKPGGRGCLLVVLGTNALLIGLLAFSFSHGPYSSQEQELWYRYGSIGFLLLGAVLPAIALWLGAMRSQRAIIALTMWMIAVFVVCVIYAVMSGGGV